MNRYCRFVSLVVFILALSQFSGAFALPLNSSNVNLLDGLGQLHHPVQTKNPEAQKYFDQGLKLIYAFSRPAAFLSFQQAANLDPYLAMAYWGMALALGPNINESITPEQEIEANTLILKAKELSTSAPQIEKDYIAALEKRYTGSPQPNYQQLNHDYAQAMRQLYVKYPEDLDAAVLYAESLLDLNPWKLWNLNGTPIKGTLEVKRLLENVLDKNPQHIGANHYYIHAVEASPSPEQALPSAQRLVSQAPLSAHLIHMASHIYLRIGDYHAAAEANKKAVAAEKKFGEEYGMGELYPIHYIMTLINAYEMQGNYQLSLEASKRLLSLSWVMDGHEDGMVIAGYTTLLRFHRWQDILRLPEPKPQLAVANAVWHAVRGIANASIGNLTQANSEKQAFLAIYQEVPPQARFGNNSTRTILNIYKFLLDASIASAQKQNSLAIEYLQNAISIEDSLEFAIPPNWFYPIRETLGAQLLKEHKYAEAEAVFRTSLKKYPRNGRALFGLLNSLKGQDKDADEIYNVQQEYNKAWQYADQPLSLNDM